MVIIGIILDLLTINSQNANKLNILSQAYICKSVLNLFVFCELIVKRSRIISIITIQLSRLSPSCHRPQYSEYIL